LQGRGECCLSDFNRVLEVATRKLAERQRNNTKEREKIWG